MGTIIEITDDTPIAMLTVGQLREMLQTLPIGQPAEQEKDADDGRMERIDSEHYLCSLLDISRFFGVSEPTAQKYKNTFLKPIVHQYGRKFYIEKTKAMELFRFRKS